MAMVAIDACPQGFLDAYAHKISALNALYRDRWGVISMADTIVRGEHMVRIRDSIREDAFADVRWHHVGRNAGRGRA